MKKSILVVATLIAVASHIEAFNPAHLEQLLATKSCPGCDLSGANLSNMDLRNANLEKANLKGVKLSFTKFDEANLQGANLDGAKIMRADFVGANLEGAILTNLKKGDMMFQGANLRRVDFSNSDLRKGRFGSEKWRGKQYPPADITGAVFKGATLDWRLKQRIEKQQQAASSAKSPRRAISSDRGSTKTGSAKQFTVPNSAVVLGGPRKVFLAKEMYVVAGGSPMAGGFSVHQIVDALGEAKKTWKSIATGQWMVTVNKTDQMSGKRLTMKMLFTHLQASEGDGVLLKRVIANGQEFNQGQIFQLAQQLAFKAEAKQ